MVDGQTVNLHGRWTDVENQFSTAQKKKNNNDDVLRYVVIIISTTTSSINLLFALIDYGE